MTNKIILNTKPLCELIASLPVDSLGILAEILNDAASEAQQLERVSLENDDEMEGCYWNERQLIARRLRDLIVVTNSNFFTLHTNPIKENSHA